MFADLERRFRFERGDPSRWPDPATMRRAAADLALRRANLLAVRAALIAAQRERKRRGLRAQVPATLRGDEDDRREYVRSVPAVGCRGWRRLRNIERRRREP